MNWAGAKWEMKIKDWNLVKTRYLSLSPWLGEVDRRYLGALCFSPVRRGFLECGAPISPKGKFDCFFVYCIKLVLLCSENKVRSLYIYILHPPLSSNVAMGNPRTQWRPLGSQWCHVDDTVEGASKSWCKRGWFKRSHYYSWNTFRPSHGIWVGFEVMFGIELSDLWGWLICIPKIRAIKQICDMSVRIFWKPSFKKEAHILISPQT